MAKKTHPPTDEEYDKAELRLLRDRSPRVYPCGRCSWPVVDGYVCHTCGHDDSYDDDRDDWSDGI